MNILMFDHRGPHGQAIYQRLTSFGNRVTWAHGVFPRTAPKMAKERKFHIRLHGGDGKSTDQHIVPAVFDDFDCAYIEGGAEDVAAAGAAEPHWIHRGMGEAGWRIAELLTRAGMPCVGYGDNEICAGHFKDAGAIEFRLTGGGWPPLDLTIAEMQRLCDDAASPHMKALTLRQPAAWAVFGAGKDVENRLWSTKVRGTVAIHTAEAEPDAYFDGFAGFIRRAARKTRGEVNVPESRDLPRGAIVGVVDIVGCTLGSCHEPSLPSDWWEGPVGFQFARPRLLKKPIPCEGKRRFFVPPEAVLQAIAEQLG